MDDAFTILAILVVIIVVALGGFYALNQSSPEDNVTELNNTTIEDNSTLNESDKDTVNESSNVVAEKSVSSAKSSSNTVKKEVSSKKQVTSKVDPNDEIKTAIFTVSENEKGQLEGMEPGTYRETYSGNRGPISIEKID